MKKPAPPAWPDPAGLPFSLFGGAGGASAGTPGAATTSGLTAGVDWMKSFLGKMPGGSSMPGFLVPTVDVDELDKRISDLRAAESWLEVNLNVLRATIQGLEVQRHTIAAIHSWSAMSDPSKQPSATSTPGGLPPGWPLETAMRAPPEAPPPAPTGTPAWAMPPTAAPEPSPAAAEPAPPASPPGPDGPDAPGDAATAPPLATLAANNWLGFMQDQFNRVAQAALAAGDARSSAAEPKRPTPAKKVAKKAVKRAAKRAT